jgi:RES domain-containing protein
VAVAADVPDDVSRTELGIATLPAGWRAFPAPEILADLGTRWLRSGRSAVLLVPSALVPQERNYLLNPAHPEFRRIRIRRAEPFSFDPRMWKR